MLTPAIASSVAHAVLQWFESNSQCQKKVPPSECTVLSGIVLRTTCPCSATSDAEPGDKFRVLAAATGNKCLGRRDLNADGLVVNDCHAEVLTRRAFLRYLYAEALAWQENGLDSSEGSLFERHRTSHRLQLKTQHSLHLFISEAPCGDAAIYELREDVVDELVQQRAAKREVGNSNKDGETGWVDQKERSELRLTGAKVHNKRSRDINAHDNHDTPLDKKFAQAVGIARVKSGRSDLPLGKQTLSMSCSDKLAKWNALGLQGSLLLQWFEPIFLSSIVVSEDDKAMSVVKQEQALRRAVCTRLEERNALLEGSRLLCEVCVVSDIPHFSCRRSFNRVPSSLAINWTTRESSWTRSGDKQKPLSKPTDAARLAAKLFNNFELEFLVAATGLKQGAKKASKMDQVAMDRVASRLAKRNMLRAFQHLVSHKTLSASTKDLNYLELKRAVPLDASWTTPSAASASTAVIIACNTRRKQFFAAFSDWIGVPTMFKQFKL